MPKELQQGHIKDIYGFGILEKMVSKITNKILATIEEWQNRSLEKIYPMVFLDAMHYHNIVVKKQYTRHQQKT